MAQLTYFPHPNPSCRGNPLIEVMGFPMTEQEVAAACSDDFMGNLILDGVPEQYHGYYIRSLIDNLSDTYITRDEAYALYEKIRRMIEAGYKKRNPVDAVHRNKVLTAIHRDGDEQIEATHLKEVCGENIDSLLSANGSFVLAGLSGVGKTTMMIRILKLIEQFYKHTSYTNPEGETISVEEEQITHLYVQVHNRKGQKAFLRSVLEALQEATSVRYLQRVSRRDSIDEHIRQIRKAMLIHNVGILVIDEAQNIDQNRNDLQIGNNEKTSMKFIEEIFNRIGVPLFFIGTLSVLKLFGIEVTAGRRAFIDGGLSILGSDVDSHFWSRLTKQVNQTSLLDGQHDSEDVIKRHLHHLSKGIPAIAVSLMRATLCHMSKFEKGKQGVTMKALSHVFKRQFSILQKPLRALEKGKYHMYEDLQPIADLVTINQEIAQDLNQAVSVADQQADKMSQPKDDATADKNVENALDKVRKVKSKQRRTKVPEISVNEAQKMGIQDLLGVGINDNPSHPLEAK